MALRLSVLFLAFITTAAVAGPQPRIVDGQTASVGDWPAMAHLVFNSAAATNNDHYCGGLHIGDGVLLTAAHCVLAEQLPAQRVCVGNYRNSNRNACFAIVDHAKFADAAEGGTGDLALVRFSASLASPAMLLPFGAMASPAMDGSLVVDDQITAIGFGSTNFANYVAADALRQADVKVMSEADCQHLFGDTLWGPDMICLRRVSGGIAPGDSGSPLFMWSDGKPYAIAAASVSNGLEAGYARYSSHHEWIAEVMSGWQQQAAQRYLHLVLAVDANTVSGQLTIHNWSTEERTLQISGQPDDSPFTVDDSDCRAVPAMADCQLRVVASRGDGTLLPAGEQLSLAFDGEAPQLLQLQLSAAVPLAVTASPEHARWSQLGGWQADESGASLILGEDQLEAMLLAEIEGPGNLMMTLASTIASGDGLFTLMVDGQPYHFANGQCASHALVVPLAEGSHQLSWRVTRSNGASQAEARVGALAWVDQLAPLSEPDCGWSQTAAANGSGGGGSVSLAALLSLMILAFCRRPSLRHARSTAG